jgi:rhamnulokinase
MAGSVKPKPAFVAVDLGAESGRVVLGRLDRSTIVLEELSRFANRPVGLPSGLHWNAVELFRESLAGIALATRTHAIRGIGFDTWGVDYGLLDERGRLLGLPFHYRDRRTETVVERVAGQMETSGAYEATGIRPMPINTVYQLLVEDGSAALEAADRLVLMPDLLAFWASGVTANEATAASTTGLLDARTGTWARGLVGSLGLPDRLFRDVVEPGTVLGPLSPIHADSLRVSGDPQIIATAGHDTAAAFAGTPLQGDTTAVLSSGTWSLIGLELDRPVTTEAARTACLSNERGVFGTVRLLRNVLGLWLIQGCRAAWTTCEPAPSYETLVELASAATGEPALFDPDDPSLAYPGDMPARIEVLMRAAGRPAPTGRGDFIRSIFVSLACKYRLVLEQLERVAGTSIGTVHVVGGGSRNSLLCQLTADLTGREVLAGPAEATALGNILVQACALGDICGLEEMRAITRASFPPVHYHPAGDGGQAAAIYRRFLDVTGLSPS